MRINEVRTSWTRGDSKVEFDSNIMDQFEKGLYGLVYKEFSIEDFVKHITPLDKWAFRNYHGSPQKSNNLNTGQNKNFPLIKETVWTAVFTLISKKVKEKTGIEFKVLQGKVGGQIAVACGTCGTVKTKDADTGLALKHPDDEYYVPVIAAECKGGHACSTCHDGIWGQGIRMRQQFPNALQMLITDCHVTVNSHIPVEAYSSGIQLTVCERGENNKEKWLGGIKDKAKKVKAGIITPDNIHYHALNVKTIENTINKIVAILSDKSEEYWLTMNPLQEFSGEYYRESLDNSGLFIAPELR